MLENNIVCKFGGTSIGSSSAIRQAANIILDRSEVNQMVVVVSATAGTTNTLFDIYDSLSRESGEKLKWEDDFLKIKNNHLHMAHDLAISINDNLKLHELLFELEESILEILNKKGSYGKRELDELLSFGERLSSHLFTSYLKKIETKRGIIHLDARKVIITDGQYGEALPDGELLSKAIQKEIVPLLKNHGDHTIFITEGYIGSSKFDGTTTTLGRGGSDYTAALLVHGLKWKKCEIWTDVSGIFTIDPKISKEAKTISYLDQMTAAELAYWGAKVLHPATLLPIFGKDIELHVKNTFAPNESGTLILNRMIYLEKRALKEANNEEQIYPWAKVLALSVRKGQVLLTLMRVKKHSSYGLLANIFLILTKYKISVDHVTTSEISTSLTLYEPSLLTSAVLEELSNWGEVIIEKDLSLISLVGPSLLEMEGGVGTILNELTPYSLRALYMGASKNNISLLVKDSEANQVVSVLHHKYLL